MSRIKLFGLLVFACATVRAEAQSPPRFPGDPGHDFNDRPFPGQGMMGGVLPGGGMRGNGLFGGTPGIGPGMPDLGNSIQPGLPGWNGPVGGPPNFRRDGIRTGNPLDRLNRGSQIMPYSDVVGNGLHPGDPNNFKGPITPPPLDLSLLTQNPPNLQWKIGAAKNNNGQSGLPAEWPAWAGWPSGVGLLGLSLAAGFWLGRRNPEADWRQT
jgi:hypothetical protein